MTGKIRSLILVVAFSAFTPFGGFAKPFAIVHATLLTMTHGTVQDGAMIINNGKIIDLGNDVSVPSDAEIVDARGQIITPGLIDPHSHLGDYSLPVDFTALADGNEATGNIQARVRAQDSINPEDPEIPRAVSGGVTMVQTLPGSADDIGGETMVIKLLGDTAAEMKYPNAPTGLKMAWGENPKRVYGEKGGPQTLMGEMAVVRQAFYDAKHYLDEKNEWEKEKKGVPPRVDLNNETLAKVLEGKIKIHVHSYQVNHFDALFRLQDEFNLQIAALHHALNAYKIAPEIARRKIGVITFGDLWGFKVEAWDAIPQNAWILWKEGVTVSLHTDNPVTEEKYYIKQAALVSHYGVPEDAALQMETINPAKILGIDQWVGSLDKGKDADLVLWDGDPVSPRSHVQKVWINGRLVYTKKDRYLPWKGKEPVLP